ncbi:MAG: cobalamin-dependent protein [Bacteroidales bacterium]|nr:cobalamin-dependent protein [Bacteroidales bacterium]
MDNTRIISNYLERALLSLDQDTAENIVLDAVKTETPIETAGNLISNTLKRIGDSWENGDIALSQVYTSSIICEKIIDKILPPQSSTRRDQPKTAIAVFEDYHLLGKRIIYSTLRASGIELMDLGGGLTIDKIIKIVKEEKIKILLISVLMLPSALRIKELKKQIANINVKIIVGGAPFRFDEELWREIDADYYGKDSAEALEIVNKLLEEKI